jgi:hypothetical protein
VLTASCFEGSTRDTLAALFSSRSQIFVSPPSGPAWPDEVLRRKLHVINCHGFTHTPQVGARAHPALFSRNLAGRIATGTVAAVNACFGAELYQPLDRSGVANPPICNAYLGGGAYGYFGSTCASYGGQGSNQHADRLITGFLSAVLAGRTLGHAVLHGVHCLLASLGTYDSRALKTLSQFVLLGDPSLQPFEAAAR